MWVEILDEKTKAKAVVAAHSNVYVFAHVRITEDDGDTAKIQLDAGGFRRLASACTDAANLIDASIASRKAIR